MSAERCPVCNGTGRYLVRPEPGLTSPGDKPCHGCGGKGWVEIYNYLGLWRDPCDTCPYKKPFQITYGGGGGSY